jgi:hypothetical protein
VLFVHQSTDNIIRDNFFISSSDQRVAFEQSKGTVLEHNIWWSGGSINFEAPVDAISVFRNNIVYSTSHTLTMAPIQLDKLGKRVALDTTGNALGDPGFVDVSHNNFQFGKNSLASTSGMSQPPKLSEIGPRVPIISLSSAGVQK